MKSSLHKYLPLHARHFTVALMLQMSRPLLSVRRLPEVAAAHGSFDFVIAAVPAAEVLLIEIINDSSSITARFCCGNVAIPGFVSIVIRRV